MARKPDIELVAISKRFGDTVAVDSVSLRGLLAIIARV
jgi:hypothetical protein